MVITAAELFILSGGFSKARAYFQPEGLYAFCFFSYEKKFTAAAEFKQLCFSVLREKSRLFKCGCCRKVLFCRSEKILTLRRRPAGLP